MFSSLTACNSSTFTTLNSLQSSWVGQNSTLWTFLPSELYKIVKIPYHWKSDQYIHLPYQSDCRHSKHFDYRWLSQWRSTRTQLLIKQSRWWFWFSKICPEIESLLLNWKKTNQTCFPTPHDSQQHRPMQNTIARISDASMITNPMHQKAIVPPWKFKLYQLGKKLPVDIVRCRTRYDLAEIF